PEIHDDDRVAVYRLLEVVLGQLDRRHESPLGWNAQCILGRTPPVQVHMAPAGSYTGRFAPSPTGPPHFGSLIPPPAGRPAARKRRGRWLVRIEDLDGPRVVPGAEDEILRQLEACGLGWDGPILRQSERSAQYEDALRRLAGRTYLCGCTRKELEDSALALDG